MLPPSKKQSGTKIDSIKFIFERRCLATESMSIPKELIPNIKKVFNLTQRAVRFFQGVYPQNKKESKSANFGTGLGPSPWLPWPYITLASQVVR